MEVWSLVLVSLLSIGAVALLKQLWSYYRVCKMAKAIPGPPTHWLYGNIHQFSVYEDGLKNVLQQMKIYKSTLWRAWIGPFTLLVIVVDPEAATACFKLRKSKAIYSFLEPVVGKGLGTAEGSQWARNRRLLTNAFHFAILKPYVAVYHECSNILISKWSKAASQGEAVLAYKSMKCLALDILLRCSCSYNSHCQEDDAKQVPYVDAVNSVMEFVADSYQSPLYYTSKWFYMYCTPSGWKFRHHLKIFHGFAEKIIQDRKKALGLTGSRSIDLEAAKIGKDDKHLDFLDVLLTARDDSGIGLTDIEIRDEVDTFMYAGHDTTSNGMTFAIYCLAKYPEHQEKCREEINKVLEGREELEYEDLSKLNYTTWCIKEALRLYPPVPFFPREFETEEDSEIGGYQVPKEALIGQHILSIHRNPKYWDDPDTFDPLRFRPDNVKVRHPYAYMPFSAGPRNCIGQHFALNEERVVIANVIRKFRLSLVEGHQVKLRFKMALTVENDVKLQLEQI